MPGDIKLAALADTTAETLSDINQVTNGTFVTDTNWSKGIGWTINTSTGVASCDGTQTGNTNLTQQGTIYGANLNFEVGKEYVLTFDATVSAGFITQIEIGGTYDTTDITSSGTYTKVITASSTNDRLGFTANPDFVGTIDNVTVTDGEADRSVNNNGLIVHGSITKAAVATGADLVAYSGFSTSNYLEQPYNDDLDFGTGDFCVMGWVNLSGTTNCGIAARGVAASTSGMVALSTANSNNTIRFDIGASNLVSSSTIPAGTWAFVVAKRESGVAYLFVNGAQVGSGVNTQTATNTSATLKVGQLTFASSPLVGSLALLRISATAPTADQIRKIYEDEKFLFQEDAKATLTGTSDAVTALAHDPDTDLLHVGTSGGRSVFQGLRRVEEHTGTNSQSLAAISAVDGLVVEGK
jgi:hypothetical protein